MVGRWSVMACGCVLGTACVSASQAPRGAGSGSEPVFDDVAPDATCADLLVSTRVDARQFWDERSAAVRRSKFDARFISPALFRDTRSSDAGIKLVALFGHDDQDLLHAMSRASHPERYLIAWRAITPTGGVQVRDLRCASCSVDGEVPSDLREIYERTIRRLSIPVAGWPGTALSSHRPGKGDETKVFEEPIAAMVDLRLHGQPTATAATVRFVGRRSEMWGEGLVSDVTLVGKATRSCGCNPSANDGHSCDEGVARTRWDSEARATGQLVVRASDGAFIALHLHGPLTDTETPCRVSAQGQPPEGGAQTWVGGEVSFESIWSDCPRPL
jgi:hypothetical protein